MGMASANILHLVLTKVPDLAGELVLLPGLSGHRFTDFNLDADAYLWLTHRNTIKNYTKSHTSINTELYYLIDTHLVGLCDQSVEHN